MRTSSQLSQSKGSASVRYFQFFHVDGKDNPADILTNFCSICEWYENLKPRILWYVRGDVSDRHLSTEGGLKLTLSALGSTSS